MLLSFLLSLSLSNNLSSLFISYFTVLSLVSFLLNLIDSFLNICKVINFIRFVTPKGDHWLSQRYSELYLNTLSKPLRWLSKKCRRRDLNSQPQRPLSGSISSLMLQTARFYARLYYYMQTRAYNLLRQKVITYWVSAIVSYILTRFLFFLSDYYNYN